MGSYAFNDSVRVNVTIDWGWVLANADAVLGDNPSLLSALGLPADLTLSADTSGVRRGRERRLRETERPAAAVAVGAAVAAGVEESLAQGLVQDLAEAGAGAEAGAEEGGVDSLAAAGERLLAELDTGGPFDYSAFRALVWDQQTGEDCAVFPFVLSLLERYHGQPLRADSAGGSAGAGAGAGADARSLAAAVLKLHSGSVGEIKVSFENIRYDRDSELVVMEQLSLVFMSSDSDSISPAYSAFERIGDARVTAAVAAALFPDETISYEAVIPSIVTLMHNSTSAHAPAFFDGEMVRSLFDECSRSLRGSGSAAAASVEYSTRNHPLPLTAQQSLFIQVILSIFASLLMLIPLCYLPSSFVTFVVRERVSLSKHLQLVSSVSPYVYWAASYAYDLALFLVLIVCVFVALLSYGQNASAAFTSSLESSFALFFLLFTYGASVMPLCYIYSFSFENHSTAQISIMTWNFITGFVFVLAYFIMTNIDSTRALGMFLVHIFRFFPPYNVGEGLINISANYYYNKLLNRTTSYWAWEVAGRDIVFMTVEAVGYFLIVLLTESEYFLTFMNVVEKLRTNSILDSIQTAAAAAAASGRPDPGPPPDPAVAAEAVRCQDSDTHPADWALLLVGLEKVFPPPFFGGTAKYAVRDFNLACSAGERFGLLGINGAGKTTTLGMLTGGLQPTRGAGFIAGKPLAAPETRALVGFCPQADPLLDLMTGAETLRFFGKIRGMPDDFLEKRVSSLIARVGLSAHANKPCGTYSGGNRRKLSLAVALVGDPMVLFLDEPSTGMDPVARRHMWEVITEVSEDKSVILTTHSMEECEALCTRIGIMVSGRLRCLGSSQQLKSTHGVGYEIEVRRSPSLDTAACLTLIQGAVPSARLDEEHGSFFRITAGSGINLSATFDLLESMKASGKIVSYSVSQSSLEQIFIKFASLQEEERYGVPDSVLMTAESATERKGI
jgi:ABC-type multidrug transport system ATPase subunit